MNITIIGTGYVGLVNGACFATNGAHVTCVDIDKEKIEKLNKGELPIYEELLEPMVHYGLQTGKLKFSTDYSSCNEADLIFICVGTPEKEDGSADLKYVFGCVNDITNSVGSDHECVVVVKSTVPVGTTDRIREIIRGVTQNTTKIHVAFNPEFLKEGYAVNDCTKPDRVVLGLENSDDYITFEYNTLHKLYEDIMKVPKDKIIDTDVRSAEMVKYASNAMLATRISFMNEIANLCEAVGANADDVSKCVGLDSRIGPKFLKAGCGYGGSCFPKDVKALMKTAEDNNHYLLIVGAVDAVNEMQKDIMYEKYKEFFKDTPAKKACVLGLAFKPGTDDMREAPSINLINSLLDDGVEVVACDPVAVFNAKKIFGSKIKYEDDPYRAAEGADAVFLVTEWEQYKTLDLNKIKETMRGDVFIDGRGVNKRDNMERLGFKFDRIG